MVGLGLTGRPVCLIAAGAIAHSKNRNAFGWALMTGLLPVVGLVIVAVLPALLVSDIRKERGDRFPRREPLTHSTVP